MSLTKIGPLTMLLITFQLADNKQADNTADIQWALTVYILQVNTWVLRHGPKELP